MTAMDASSAEGNRTEFYNLANSLGRIDGACAFALVDKAKDLSVASGLAEGFHRSGVFWLNARPDFDGLIDSTIRVLTDPILKVERQVI